MRGKMEEKQVRRLGNIMIVIGVLYLPTLIFTMWGLILIAVGALLRISAPKRIDREKDGSP